jgi:hypothetical protein
MAIDHRTRRDTVTYRKRSFSGAHGGHGSGIGVDGAGGPRSPAPGLAEVMFRRRAARLGPAQAVGHAHSLCCKGPEAFGVRCASSRFVSARSIWSLATTAADICVDISRFFGGQRRLGDCEVGLGLRDCVLVRRRVDLEEQIALRQPHIFRDRNTDEPFSDPHLQHERRRRRCSPRPYRRADEAFAYDLNDRATILACEPRFPATFCLTEPELHQRISCSVPWFTAFGSLGVPWFPNAQ